MPNRVSFVARALRRDLDAPTDALGPVSPYQMRVRQKAEGIFSTAKSQDEQKKAGELLDTINLKRALRKVNSRNEY